MSGPALAVGEADHVITITSLTLEHGEVPFTFNVIVTCPAAEVGVIVGPFSVVVLVMVAVPVLTT